MGYCNFLLAPCSEAHLSIEGVQEIIQRRLLGRAAAEQINLKGLGIHLTILLPEKHSERNRKKVAFHRSKMHQTVPEFKGRRRW